VQQVGRQTKDVQHGESPTISTGESCFFPFFFFCFKKTFSVNVVQRCRGLFGAALRPFPSIGLRLCTSFSRRLTPAAEKKGKKAKKKKKAKQKKIQNSCQVLQSISGSTGHAPVEALSIPCPN
jgi:hypothetical protein